MRYLLLHRAIENFGDYLIFERAKSLIKFLKPNVEVLSGVAYKELEKQFSRSELNNLDAIIIAGGPGIRRNIYPDIYPINMHKLKTPLYFLGVGSNISFINAMRNNFLTFMNIYGNNYTINFTKKSLEFLKSVQEPIGVRDYIAKRILENLNMNAVMNGCPAWYDVQYIGRDFQKPKKIDKIIFSVPANKKLYLNQSLKIMKDIKNYFYDAKIIVSFNHGFLQKNKSSSKYTKIILNHARNLGFEVVDMSGSVQKSYIYDECDIHVGYRVHSHLYFLSHRKPSILIAEDLRGVGAAEALNTPYLRGWESIKFPNFIKLSVSKAFNRPVYSGLTNNISKKLIKLIEDEIYSNFSRFAGIGKVIDSYYYNNMKKFIEKNLPG